MNKKQKHNKSIWDFLDSQTTREVRRYINTHKDYIRSKQNNIDSLACHFCRRNEDRFFLYLIQNQICDFPKRKESCDPHDGCEFFCCIFDVEGMTAKEIEEDEDLKKALEDFIKQEYGKLFWDVI